MTPDREDLRLANLGTVLSDAIRAGRVSESDARRIIVHDLRRLSANKKLGIHPRSIGADESIRKYAPQHPPKNASSEALHADHYGMMTSAEFVGISSVEAWVEIIQRAKKSIVCVTDAENHGLAHWERKGHSGPEKYELAGIEFLDRLPWESTGS